MTRRALLAFPGFAAFADAAEAPPPDWLRWMDAASVPGLAAIVVQEAKPPRIITAGVTSSGGPAVTADTVFAAASLSKQLTAMAMLKLESEGRWSLDRPMGEICEIPGSPSAGRITARHLLSHSSGFPNWRSRQDESLTPADPPGKAFRYSGEGYVYLQRALEKLTGKAFARLIHDSILQPLEITSSSFAWRTLGAVALPHDRQGELRGKPEERLARLDAAAKSAGKDPLDLTVEDQEKLLQAAGQAPLPNNFAINAAASFQTTPRDYARFLAKALNNRRFGETQVTIRPGLGWGLGWGTEGSGSSRAWWQWGDNGGYKNFVFAEPARRRAFAVFTNGDKGRSVYERVIRALAGVDPVALIWL